MATELMVGVFDSEEKILAAAKDAMRSGISIYDAYTPFAVHGLDHALGLAPSPLPKLCFRFGALGLTLTLAFQYWTSTFNWPMNIGGKSLDASPAMIPVAFELTVLFAGIGTVLSFLRMQRLSPVAQPALEGFGGVDDRFVLALRRTMDGSDAVTLKQLLHSHGAARVEEVSAP